LLVVMLNQVGVLPAANLRRWNRGIIFGFFVFAALVIPGGDAVSMTILVIALTVLFEGALLVAMAHDKKHARLVAAQGLEGLDDDEASPLNLDTAPVDAARPIEVPPH
jgi:sec-independent protein translocase protein TatC